MNIKFGFKNEYVEIELSDTNFVKNIWLPYYNNLLSIQKKIKVKYGTGLCGSFKFCFDDLEKIKKDIDNIKSMVPFPIHEVFTSNNPDDMHFDFNRLHRCYTSGIMSLTRENHLNWNRNFVDPGKDLDEILPIINIKLSEEKSKLLEFIDNLNTHIHHCELQAETKNSVICEELTKNLVHYEIRIDNNFEMKKVDSKYMSIDQKFNVWVYKEICGKDIVQCFIDNDNPRNHDITPPTHIHGNIFIDLYNSRLKVINSDSFHKWLDLYGLSVMDSHGLIPLGKVVGMGIISIPIKDSNYFIWNNDDVTVKIT